MEQDSGKAGMVVEWAAFTVRDDVTREQLFTASDELQEKFLSRQKGFIKRELLHLDGQKWVDLLHWASRGDADAAMGNAMSSDICKDFFALMTPAAESGCKHLTVARRWELQEA